MTVRESRPEIQRQIRWLMTLRGVTVTTLLICAFGVELLLRATDTLRPLFTLAAVAYGMVLLYAVLYRWLRGPAFMALQLVGDALLITLFVGITGGIDSPMSFLYLLPISVASMLLYRRGGVALALVCWMLYAGLVVFGLGVPTLLGTTLVALAREPGTVAYFLVAHLVALLAFALLSSYLSERLRVQGRELAERRGTVARLKALNENIIESINSGLITTDRDGCVNFLNRGGVGILGRTPEELQGRRIEGLLGVEPGFFDKICQTLVDNPRFRFERYYDRPDGSKIFLGIAVSNLHDKQGIPLGYIFIFQDLTEIHAMEQEMRLKERMVALGEMAAGMAHELRNPLAAISGAVQYLKGDTQPSGESLELMDIILRESHRLDQAIRDFLTFARPGTFAPDTVDLVKLIDDNVKLLRKSQEFKPGHRVATRYPGPEVECRVDPNRVRQIFWNLATNALKAMPDGGTLSISLEWVDAGRFLELNFADEGPGMDADAQQRYFQPFSSSFSEGTGLGAAIVYRLIEEHGGRVHLITAPGRGTRVQIILPSGVAAPPTEAPHPELRAVGG